MTALSILMLTLTFLCWLPLSDSKTVVTIPFPFTSHVKYHTNVARALTKRGHQVWLASPVYILEKRYLDTSGFDVIPYETASGLEKETMKLLSGSYFEQKPEKFFQFLEICGQFTDTLLRNESFLNAIKQKKPDLIVLDNLPMYYSMAVLPYRLRVPFAFMGSVYYPTGLRISFSLAEVPYGIFPFTNKMTFLQRLQNTLFHIVFHLYNPSFQETGVSLYAPEMDYLPLSQLLNKAEVFIVEFDHVLDYPKPTMPNVKLIGGTATGPVKPLPPDFKSFMDSAKQGVVIVSFGSYVLNLPEHISDKVLQVLQQLPMKSVFRSNLTSPDPENILTANWIPQNDLLGHAHTKVFVSHCGKNGQYEALYHAVPVVATPLFIDQPYNAVRARDKGFAEILDLNTCTVEEMKNAILTVANEPKYKESAVKHSNLFKELYGVPLESAAYWLDHVMKYGGDYMRSAGQQMPYYQFLLLDVIFFIACVFMLAVGLVFVVIKFTCRFIWKKKVKAE